MRSSRGFTLIELLITVAILAILLGVGVPSFVDYIRNSRVSTQVNELATALNFARSEAVTRGDDVTVTALGASFADGWCIHLGAGCNGDSDNELRRHEALLDITLQAPPAQPPPAPPRIMLPSAVVFGRLGQRTPPSANEPGVTIVPTSCVAGAHLRARVLSISPGGRIAVSRADCP